MTSSYEYFADGEPNGAIGSMVIMIDNHQGQWDDRDVYGLGYYACEHRNGMFIYMKLTYISFESLKTETSIV